MKREKSCKCAMWFPAIGNLAWLICLPRIDNQISHAMWSSSIGRTDFPHQISIDPCINWLPLACKLVHWCICSQNRETWPKHVLVGNHSETIIDNSICGPQRDHITNSSQNEVKVYVTVYPLTLYYAVFWSIDIVQWCNTIHATIELAFITTTLAFFKWYFSSWRWIKI